MNHPCLCLSITIVKALDHLFQMLIPLHYEPNIKFLNVDFNFQVELCIHHDDNNRPYKDISLSESFVLIQTESGSELCHSDACNWNQSKFETLMIGASFKHLD